MSEFFWLNKDSINQKPCFKNPLCTLVLITLADGIDESNQTNGVNHLLEPLRKQYPNVGQALYMLEREGILKRDMANDRVEFDPLHVACEVPEGK